MILQQTFTKLLQRWQRYLDHKQRQLILGLFYGMGKGKLMNELDLTKEKADELFKKYHGKAPFVKQLMNKVMNAALNKGQIKTLLGRRCRFPKYEPILNGSDWGKYIPPEDEERMKELTRNGTSVKRF